MLLLHWAFLFPPVAREVLSAHASLGAALVALVSAQQALYQMFLTRRP
jgi:hypothetical protein